MKTQKNGFKDLDVWQLSQDFAVKIYQVFKSCTDYSFCDQIKRAAVSISNNIAEGAERNTSVDFARFLDIAKGSCGEVRSMLILGNRFGFLSDNTAKELENESLTISRKIAGLASYLRKQTR